MKSKFLLFCILLQTTVFSQSIKLPLVLSSDDPTTSITEIVTNNKNTVVSFKHICAEKGSWVQLNKSMYLQDADGEDRYNYVRSEGIPLRPERFTATEDNQEVTFKVYFEKLKPGTQKINVIERARSLQELNDGINFFNYYGVNLSKSADELLVNERILTKDVTLFPPLSALGDKVQIDTAVSIGDNIESIWGKGEMANWGPIMGGMYNNMIDAQLKVYSNPTIINQLARITKNYYDALVKVGFSSESALKILISKPLISLPEGTK